jgi:carboxyl-terminal processing protease
MKYERVRYFLLIILAGLVGYFVGVNKVSFDWKNYKPHIEVSSKTPPPSLMQGDFGIFWTVLERLESTYYDKTAIQPQKLINGAITGMVNSLEDPYTVYLPPKQNEDFKQSMAGEFQGIGAELGMKDKDVIVIAPLDGSPAKKAGIKAGDIIAKVDGEYIAGLSLSKVVDKIRGQKGTEVTLTVLHKSEDKTVDIKIVRDKINVPSLTSWTKKIKDIDEINPKSVGAGSIVENKVVYIRLSQFGDKTNKEWLSFANDIDRQLKADPSIKGIVFDLRNNPGGYLNDAVYISSEFVKSGAAVMQEDKDKVQTKYPVSGKGLLTDVKVVILINKGSASASEIVSGALRDHGRAKLVGETSFGKGTIQQAEDLGGGAGIHVTIAKWLTPKGTWVHKSGLEPDVKVEVDKKDPSHDLQLEDAIIELLKTAN